MISFLILTGSDSSLIIKLYFWKDIHTFDRLERNTIKNVEGKVVLGNDLP